MKGGDERTSIVKRCVLGLALLGGAATHSAAWAFQLNVVDNAGNPVTGFRWLLQEDTTFPVDPANPSTNPDELLSFNFHRSHHPIARNAAGQGLKGNSAEATAAIDAPPGRYFVSVLPYSGYSISGKPVELVSGGSETVTVTVQKHAIPTAQIAVYLFHDNYPINGAPDLPEEQNPPPGDPAHVDWTEFHVQLEEPAGRYGIAGGQVIQDAFGNPLGTTYAPGACAADGSVDDDPQTNFTCLVDGQPTVVTMGDGTLHPAADGTLLIKNLSPGKYGVIVIPPPGSTWQQTSTIEGTKVNDAWVKASEPAFFVEFGPPGPHVFFGFIKSTADGGFPPIPVPPGANVATVSGTITDMHMSRPPTFDFHSGRPFPACWVAINEATPAGLGRGLWAGPCDADSNFSITGLPPGGYQLKVFDANLDVVIASQGFTVDASGTCDGGTVPDCNFGNVAVFNWFARLNTGVFNDVNQNGFWDAGETGIGPESQDVTLRWRDGTVYQNFPTDTEGFAPFDEVFPFFHWLVAEVSFANKKATGATYVVDAGGPVDTSTEEFPGYGELSPQLQAENGDLPYRTEVGQVLTTGFQGFLGQTSVMHFGKTDYLAYTAPDFTTTPPRLPTYVGENGGISGIVYYATTRAENEPRFAAAEEWEPGIPRVQVALYADGDIDSYPVGDFPAGVGDVDWNGDGVRDLDDDAIDDLDGDGVVTRADVDNYPLGNFPGQEDVDRDGDLQFDLGDAVQVVWTDSWDDNLPTGCQGLNSVDATELGLTAPVTDDRCFDGLRNFNQIRPGVFDGGFAFADYDLAHLTAVRPGAATAIQAYYDAVSAAVGPEKAATLQLGLIPGDYIVEAVAPPGYEHIKEEDRNVDFGDAYVPSPQALPVACVGELRAVPPYLSMATMDGSGAADQLIAGVPAADVAAPFAGDERPLCDLKKVPLSAAQNAGAEFWLMTDVPVAANVSGVILNDLGNEFNPNSPAFGEKYAPANVPVGFYDWNGKEVARVYGDTFGRYNLVVPSTFTADRPQPSGMSPNMLVACMNDAGQGAQPDPFWNPQFSQFCYTFQYMPGTTTYLDTPVVPIAAFASPVTNPVDCERPAATPLVASVTRVLNGSQDGPYALRGQSIRVNSVGLAQVDNPDWDGTAATPRKITRDYSFKGPENGTPGCTVWLEDSSGTRRSLQGVSCTASQATGTVRNNTPIGPHQVVVVNPDGTESPLGVTLTVGDGSETVRRVSAGQSIQAAIDAAADGDLILVGPGTYDELLVMHKAVKLQGWGAGAVTINARQVPTEKISAWRTKVRGLIDNGSITQLPGQELGVPGFPALAEAVFPTEEGAGIFAAGMVVQTQPNGNVHTNFSRNPGARIDGFSIVGASTGGGVVVNGYAADLAVSNNRIMGNAGAFGGGVRVGHPQLSHEDAATGLLVYDHAHNERIRIHHNHIARNGGFGGAGAGISLHTGADDYRVERNWVCGNFSQGNGGGIGQLGLARDLGDRDVYGGVIADNWILFNESFAQAEARSGGGVFIGGQPALQAENGLLLSPGTGSIRVQGNWVRGNLAGAGDGGGIQLASVNGRDIADNPTGWGAWYRIDLLDNEVSNNVAALAGGGIAIQDAINVLIENTKVAHNDSVATAALAFSPGSFNRSSATPAGIVSRTHSLDLALQMGVANVPDPDWLAFSDPAITSSIVEHNRSFFWLNYDDPTTPQIETGLFPANCDAAPAGCNLANVDGYTSDLAVMDGPFTTSASYSLDPRFSRLTNVAGYDASNSNFGGDTGFVNPYFNGQRGNIDIQEFTTLQTAGAFDEGGNFIQVTFGPLSLIDSATGLAYSYALAAP
jgi:hypothetical protein